MKIVFDTNVLLAGLFARGMCESLLDATFGNADHQIFACDMILEEFNRNATKKFRVPPERLSRTLTVLRQNLEIVTPAKVAISACRDKNDLPILGTLVASDADCLVTGDEDLLTLKQFEGKPILTPRICFELLMEQ